MSKGILAALAGPDKLRVEMLFRTVKKYRDDGDLVMGMKVLDELEPLLGANPAGSRAGTNTTTTGGANLQTALAQWTAARATVLGSLKELEAHIRAMNDPDGDEAIALLKAIQANLGARPDNARAVAELENYLKTDQIITEAEEPNGFGVQDKIRSFLLPALASIRVALPK
jgi:hypothetical protein